MFCTPSLPLDGIFLAVGLPPEIRMLLPYMPQAHVHPCKALYYLVFVAFCDKKEVAEHFSNLHFFRLCFYLRRWT